MLSRNCFLFSGYRHTPLLNLFLLYLRRFNRFKCARQLLLCEKLPGVFDADCVGRSVKYRTRSSLSFTSFGWYIVAGKPEKRNWVKNTRQHEWATRWVLGTPFISAEIIVCFYVHWKRIARYVFYSIHPLYIHTIYTCTLKVQYQRVDKKLSVSSVDNNNNFTLI